MAVRGTVFCRCVRIRTGKALESGERGLGIPLSKWEKARRTGGGAGLRKILMARAAGVTNGAFLESWRSVQGWVGLTANSLQCNRD